MLDRTRGFTLCTLLTLMAGCADAQEVLPFGTPDVVGLDPMVLAEVTAVLDEAVAEWRIAGAVVGIARRGKLAYTHSPGVQDVETGIEMTDASIFRIYSMAKSVTAVAAMILHEEGHFQLDDPVSDYLPQFADVVVLERDGSTRPPSRAITIEDLLLHTDGLSHRSSPEARSRRRRPVSASCRLPYARVVPSGDRAGLKAEPYRLLMGVRVPFSRS